MNKILYTALLAAISLYTHARVNGYVKNAAGNPLIGATIHWEGTTTGSTTDNEGHFTLESSTHSHTLVVSYLGYTSQMVEVEDEHDHHHDHDHDYDHDYHLEIVLQPDAETLDEVTVSQRDKGTHLSRISPIQTTKLSGAELCKAACCNLAESFTTNASVDVSYSDAVTGAKQIRLLGLSGLYVQMMAENMPAFRGLASIYGLEYVPGAWMESIQISKGTASVINGYEAIAGQINVEYKKPERSETFFVNGFMNNELRAELNVNTSVAVSDNWSTMLLGHYKNGTVAHDGNGDGFLDTPLTEQYNFSNRWNYQSDKYMAHYGVKLINESRQAGQMDYYTGETNAYQIDIATERYELITKQTLLFDAETGHSMALQASGSYHMQNSIYGSRLYDGAHSNAYLNLIYQNRINGNPDHQLSMGASFIYDEYAETLDTLNLNRSENVPGVFAQYTYSLDDKLTVLAGLRGDYHNEYGFFITPRLHTKYQASEQIDLRGSVGLGYRSANVLAENSYLLASSRSVEIASDLEQEKALNSGLNATFYIPVGHHEAVLSADYYYTRFMQQIIPDTDSDPQKVSFYNLDGLSYSQSVQLQAKYELLHGLDVTAAYRITDVKMTIGDQLREKPLISRYKGLLVLSYQTPLKKWQVDFTSQFNGGGRMPTPNGELWGERFAPYTIMNTQVTRYFRNWSVYIGSENLSNFKMTTPIIDAADPWGEDFDASMTWGPVHGIVIYGGFRYAIESN